MSKNALPGGEAIAAIWKSSFGAVGETASAAYMAATKTRKTVVENAVSVA